MRPTLQRHKHTKGWTKSVVNSTYARQHNLEWFKCSDFYTIGITGSYTPKNPQDIPNPVLRHDLCFTEPDTPEQFWSAGTLIGTYNVTYSVKFRGEIKKDAAD